MQRQNKIFDVLTNKSGASLIFVLAIMLLLYFIGTSALVAASAAAGAGMNKQTKDRLNMYAESIHRSVLHSLRASTSVDVGKDVLSVTPDTLGGQILARIYQDAQPSLVSEVYYAGEIPINGVTATPQLNADASEMFADFDNNIDIYIDTYVTERAGNDISFDVNGEPIAPASDPREVSINSTVTVMIAVGHKGKSLTTVATYRLENASMSDRGTAAQMIIENAGDWGFVSYEKLDH